MLLNKLKANSQQVVISVINHISYLWDLPQEGHTQPLMSQPNAPHVSKHDWYQTWKTLVAH